MDRTAGSSHRHARRAASRRRPIRGLAASLAIEPLEQRRLLTSGALVGAPPVTPLVDVIDEEPNDTIATATFLGSDPFVALTGLAIDSASDVDYFRIAAHDTGTLNARIEFDSTAGDLDMQILDSGGHVIASSIGVGDIEQLTIPVVTQERYYVQVYGVNDDENTYSLEIENFPAPVPTAVVLDPADDTGYDNLDDVTSVVTDTHVFVHADLFDLSQDVTILTAAEVDAMMTPGAAVEVFVNGASVGYADVVAGTDNTIFEINLNADLTKFSVGGPNSAGPAGYPGYTNLITAAVRIFDGQQTDVIDGGEFPIVVPDPATGRTLQSPPLRVVFDNVAPVATAVPNMLATSDSGASDSDNVTNINRPTIASNAEANATVRIYVDGVFVGSTTAGTDFLDGTGTWTYTLPPLVDGVHMITTTVQDRAGNVSPTSQPLAIEIDTLAPNTAYLDIADASDTGRSNQDDVIRDNTPDFTATTEDPNAASHLLGNSLNFRIFDRPPGGAETLIYNVTTNATLVSATLPVALIDGVHNLKLEVEDLAGNISHDFLLPVTVDTAPPPVYFGLSTSATDGLDAASDSGVAGDPSTFSDRVTNDTTPTFYGTAEANSIVRLYVRTTAGDMLVGMAVAIPEDGNQAFPDGRWTITSNVDLNDPNIFPQDGLRQMFVTAEDLAGNVSEKDQELDIFLDTTGPQVTKVFITDHEDYNLFGLKPDQEFQGPTPLVNSLTIRLQDLPARDANFLTDLALASSTIDTPGVITLRGDHNGIIQIERVSLVQPMPVAGQAATATVELVFAAPLPDDRFTLTIHDSVTDLAGNRLDGETRAAEPTGIVFIGPSGDGQPGGDFIARFTVDSRPEIGTYGAANVFIDANGNFSADFPGQDNDYTNRDLNFALGIDPSLAGFVSPMGIHDGVFAGNFPIAGREAPILIADGFDKLAAYGQDPVAGGFRWLIDVNHDGVIVPADGDHATKQPAGYQINGLPVAGDFDGVTTNGDEIGLFDGTQFYFDTNHNFMIDGGDLVVSTSLRGSPIIGDFNGDGIEDLATWRNDVFYFNFGTQPGGPGTQPSWNGAVQATINWGLPGVLEQPVAADMDSDGITDIGLYLPGQAATLPSHSGNWQFLLSNDYAEEQRGGNQVSALNHPFSPTPLGTDLFAQFGDAFALPVVGNFDPPVATPQPATPSAPAPVLGTESLTPQSVNGETWYSFQSLRGGTLSAAAMASTATSTCICTTRLTRCWPAARGRRPARWWPAPT